MDSNIDDNEITAYSCRHCGSITLDERSHQCCAETMAPIEVDAVEEPDLRMLFPYVFGVSRTGMDVCVYLMGEGEATTREIATALDVNPSTATRQLTRLRELGVVEVRTESLTEGGQRHLYSPTPPEEARQRLREGLFSWLTDAVPLLDEVDRRKLAAAAERGAVDSSRNEPSDE